MVCDYTGRMLAPMAMLVGVLAVGGLAFLIVLPRLGVGHRTA